MSSNDQYSKEARDESVPLADKVDELSSVINSIGTSMLTTVGTDGKSLHSRAMRDASHDKLIFTYIFDNTSHKDDEVKQDQDVNISFCAPSSGDWVSVSGRVTNQTNERDVVAKYYNPAIRAWFGDLGDGVHDGSEKDPRVSIMQITPQEIRYFAKKETMVGQAIDVISSAVTGKVAKPGAVRTITAQEVQSLQ